MSLTAFPCACVTFRAMPHIVSIAWRVHCYLAMKSVMSVPSVETIILQYDRQSGVKIFDFVA